MQRRPNVESWFEEWRSKPRDHNCYSDVYDGNIWKEFMNYNGTPFLSKPNNMAIMLNMDFSQPYKHLKGYSVGGIYAVLMNLPRAIRYKQENVLLIGLIPGPDHDINSFLTRLSRIRDTRMHVVWTIVTDSGGGGFMSENLTNP